MSIKRTYTLALALCLTTLTGGAGIAACVGDEPSEVVSSSEAGNGQPDSALPDANKPDGSDAGTLSSPALIPGLTLWLDAFDPNAVEPFSTSDAHVKRWLDKSARQRHFAANPPERAPVFTASAINDKPAILFTQSVQQYLVGPSLAEAPALGAAELYVVWSTVGPNPPPYGLWRFGSFASDTFYTGSGGAIYDGFGSTTRQLTYVPTQVNLAKPHIYGAISTVSEWTASINGVQIFTNGSNVVGFDAAGSLLGATSSGGTTPTNYFQGAIGEIVVYDHKISDQERRAVQMYLAGRWGVTLGTPDGGLP